MSDQETVTATLVARMVAIEQARFLKTLTKALDSRGYRGSEYEESAVKVLDNLGIEHELSGEAECTYGSSCCNYCHDCETHHPEGDGDTDEQCNLGHCHDCEHRCDDI